jgi:glutamate/tyrosine decarboxylase-like PLP-dependent enzyme
VDVEAVKAAITADTILIVGSAPQYPHGVVSPVTMMMIIMMLTATRHELRPRRYLR